ncbi:Glycosyltransferase sugar-binding region containing DXD motif-containing protein [Succinivibrio dextrinosolvens]|uniref:glycosyltransferase family 32 protein n=1 Tax=Succinivibrio dextrinosolvens TaxID=83771 RepID=UPI0008E0CBBC|nr:glycosyltransferase [Succinivibrio dextrinosolvens]SFS83110.1 Glycosyltransferase sugar-binding region containing DXD motif-containing protein [Succinivibrio dextrinosolvens]
MIPKVIHYCWFGKNPLPSNIKKCIKSWEKYCPDYEIRRWDESNFDVLSHPFIKAAYEEKKWAFVSDYARLKVVYDYGGIYLDTDVELLRNLDFLLNYNFYVGVQQADRLCNTGLGFGAKKHCLLVLNMMKQYDNLIFDLNKQSEFACPILNNRVIVDIGYNYSDSLVEIHDCAILPCKMLDPVAPGRSRDLLCKDSVSIHHYTATWQNKKNRLRRKIFVFVGQRRINKIKKMCSDFNCFLTSFWSYITSCICFWRNK